MRRTPLAGLAAGALAFALTGLGTAASPAAADPLPADYSGSTHGDVVALEVAALSGLLSIPTLAGANVGHSATATDSTASPATTAESANLHAVVAGIGLPIDSNSAEAPPSATYSGGLGQVDVPGLLDTGLITSQGEANFVSTTECVPDGTPLTSAATSLASLDLGIGAGILPDLPGGAGDVIAALTSIASVGVLETTGTTYLDGTDVVSEQTLDLAAVELLGGLATVNVDSPVVLTATSDGTSGTIEYSNPTATVTLDDSTVFDLDVAGDSVTIPLSVDVPLLGSLVLDLTVALAPDPSTTTGPTASASVTNLLSIDLGITATGGLALLLGEDIADVSLGISPMSVSATAPEGGVECDALDEEDPGPDPDGPDPDDPDPDDPVDPDDPATDDTDTGGPSDPAEDPTPVTAGGSGTQVPADDTVLPAVGAPAGLVAMLLVGLGSVGLGAWLLRRRTTLV